MLYVNSDSYLCCSWIDDPGFTGESLGLKLGLLDMLLRNSFFGMLMNGTTCLCCSWQAGFNLVLYLKRSPLIEFTENSQNVVTWRI